MTIVEQVQAAKSPQEALLAIAQGLDDVLTELSHFAPADSWGDEWITEPELDRTTEVTEDAKGNLTVALAPVGPEQQQARREFAEKIGIRDEFGEEFIEHYAKGGPLWLYYGNRDFVMRLPYDLKVQMIEEVQAMGSPAEAQEMGRDLLKAAGPGAMGDVASQVGG